MKRIISVFLIVSMFLTVLSLTACGETPASTTENTASASTASSQGEKAETTQNGTASAQGSAQTSGTTAKGEATTAAASSKSETTSAGGASSGASTDDGLDGLSKHPDFMDVNFGGKTFTFVASGGWSGGWDCYEIEAELTGNDNLISEGVAKRNALVENLYNCKIKCVNNDSPTGRVADDIALGVCTYDFCMQLWQNLIVNNYVNIAAMDLDLTHSWFDQNYIQQMSITINGKDYLYGISGKFNLNFYDSCLGLYVNKTMYDQLYATGKISTDIFEAVRSGKWTMDLFQEVSCAAVSDTNGDQAMSYAGGDIYGCVEANSIGIKGFFYGAGVSTIVRNESGSLEGMNADNTDLNYVQDVINKVIELFDSGALNSIGESDTVRCIASGQSLFNAQYLYRLHNKDKTVVYGVDYGDTKISIVPFPKFTESQEAYCSYETERGYAVKVSKAVADTGVIAKFLEVFCFHSEKVLYPAYINCLKTQCLCDEEAGEMLEIVLAGRFVDFGIFKQTGFANDQLVSLIQSKKGGNFPRSLSKEQAIVASNITDYINAIVAYEA